MEYEESLEIGVSTPFFTAMPKSEMRLKERIVYSRRCLRKDLLLYSAYNVNPRDDLLAELVLTFVSSRKELS